MSRWRTVGAIITRYWAETAAAVDAFAGLRRIGIDEISYKKGHKYLTVVVDHDSGRLVWAAPGDDKATLGSFFDALAESGHRPVLPGRNWPGDQSGEPDFLLSVWLVLCKKGGSGARTVGAL